MLYSSNDALKYLVTNILTNDIRHTYMLAGITESDDEFDELVQTIDAYKYIKRTLNNYTNDDLIKFMYKRELLNNIMQDPHSPDLKQRLKEADDSAIYRDFNHYHKLYASWISPTKIQG